MFIHEMGETECRLALQSASMGRLACAHENQPYVVPIHFAFDGKYIYGFTTVGQKVEWMRSNPLVCFEMDQVTSESRWVSVVVFGRYEELTDAPQHKRARARAHRFLARAMWWELAFNTEKYSDQPHSRIPVVFRIHVEKMTGLRATLDNGYASVATVKQGWLSKLIHRDALRT